MTSPLVMPSDVEVAEIVVNIADFAVASGNSVLVTAGLGSCVAVALHDPSTGIAGLAHILLPSAGFGPPSIHPAKYADSGIPLLAEEMRRRGAAQSRMVARLAVLSAVLAFVSAAPAFAADAVAPRAGIVLRGEIKFPRAQKMYVQTGTKDGSRLTVGLGFHGKCKGGGLGELWAANIDARPQVRVRDGRFEATLTGSMRNVGGIAARTASFEWTLRRTGAFPYLNALSRRAART